MTIHLSPKSRWQPIRTAGRIVVAVALLVILEVASAFVCTFAVIGICRLIHFNPYDGAWIYGLLASPVVLCLAILFVAKREQRRREEQRRGDE